MGERIGRVALLNTVVLNGGDAAIATAIVGSLREAFGEDVRVEAFDGSPDARDYHPDLALRTDPFVFITRRPHPLWRKLGKTFNETRILLAAACMARGLPLLPGMLTANERASLEAMAAADLAVSTGGTYLVEHYSQRGRLLNFKLARIFDLPLVLYTQSIGRFSDAEVRGALAEQLQRASLVLLRDPASLENLRANGVTRPRAEVVPDSVFAIARPEDLEAARSRRLPEQGIEVVVSVRKWSRFGERGADEGMELYLESVRQMIRELVDTRDARVTLLSTCQGIPEYWTDDSEVAVALVDGLEEPYRSRCTVDRSFHTLAQIERAYAQADLVVATRMHAAIIALSMGTPVAPIEYEFKTRELFVGLGLERWVHDIATITPEGAVARLRGMLAELEDERGAMLDGVERMRAGAAGAAELLREAVG
jgi:colanic acid/amylovoran biosynthesis protein